MAGNGRLGFTVDWRIDKGMLIEYPEDCLQYDFFLVDLQKTAWSLIIDLDGNPCVCIVRQSDKDSGPHKVVIECDLDLLLVQKEPDEPSSSRQDTAIKVKRKNFKRGDESEFVEIISQKGLDALKDTEQLLLRCRIWPRDFSFRQPLWHFVSSHWKAEKFTCTVNDFSWMQRGGRINYVLKKREKEYENLAFDLFLGDDNDTICIQETSSRYYYWIYSVSVLDSRGGKSLCLCNCFSFYESGYIVTVPLLLRRSNLLEQREKYLPNDQLTLYFEFRRRTFEGVLQQTFIGIPRLDDVDHGNAALDYRTMSTNTDTDLVDDVDHGNPAPDSRDMSTNTDTDLLTFKTCASPTSTSSSQTDDLTLSPCNAAGGESNLAPSNAGGDMYHLFNEGYLTDFELRIRSQSVQVHKAILAARSPVFLAMLTNEMQESSQKGVDIKDLEMETLKQLLNFMYMDSVPDLDWNSAMKLYAASDKYDVDLLRKKCSDILKSKLSGQNVCSILSLADAHADDDLKEFVQEFILQNEAEVIPSQEWHAFVKEDVNLSSQVMLYLYKKRIETK